MKTQKLRTLLATVYVVSLSVLSGAQAAPPPPNPAAPEFSAQYYAEWLLEVSSLISEGERQAFSTLQTDLEREEFMRRFWKARDPQPQTARNELREHFLRNVQLAWSSFSNLADHRAQALILHGPPRYTYVIQCPELHPLQLFYYPRNQYGRESFAALFVDDPKSAPFHRLWSPAEGFGGLTTSPEMARQPRQLFLEGLAEKGCWAGREHLQGFLAGALENALSWQELRRRSPFPIPPSGVQPGWVEAFLAQRSISTDSNVESEPLSKAPVSLEISFPARSAEHTELQGKLNIPTATVEPWLGLPSAPVSFALQGELFSRQPDSKGMEGWRKERFRQQFHLRPALAQGDTVPLYFYRDLLPGTYTLVVRLEDPAGESLLHDVRQVEVPQRLPHTPPSTPPLGAHHLMPENLNLLNRRPSVQIQPFLGLQVGTVEVNVLTTGTEIIAVRYELDGQVVGHTAAAPWSLAVDLGPAPRPHTLRALALAKNGAELAHDTLLINAGAQRFAIRLTEPKPGLHSGPVVHARAAIEVPVGTVLERVEFYLGEQLAATLFGPPFVHPLSLEEGAAGTYVKAVAHLADGTSTDDLVLLNVPGELDEIDVREVEFYANVFNRRRRPVEDLGREDFRLLEEGVEQQILRFERVLDLPVHVGLLIDSSSSMAQELPFAIRSALRFFDTVLTSEDQAAVITFDNRTRLAVPFTRDLGWLADGASMLTARGGTALWDSLVGTLNYFGGLEGKRALVLISDGDDQHSQFTFQDTLGFAQRAGVAIYAISLDLSIPSVAPDVVAGPSALDPTRENILRAEDLRKSKHRDLLKKLVQETGGLFFGVTGMRSLDRAFGAIEEDVRSQFLITYQSSNQGEDFREVDLQVLRRGLKVRTLGGYYP